MLNKAKKFLSQFLPLPYRRAMEQNREILSKLSSLDKRLNRLETKLLNCGTGGGNYHYPQNRQNYRLYCSPPEMKKFREVSSKFMKRDDFEKHYLALISGLDDKSRKLVHRIWHRIDLISKTKEDEPIDLFTPEEQESIEVQAQLRQSVLKISDNAFSMGEFLLPINHFDMSVFYDRHGIDLVSNQEQYKNKHIIDAGAYIGDSLLLFSKWTQKQVHCFEALTKHYELLQKTIQMNNIKNAVTIKAALGEKQGRLKFADQGNASRFTNQSAGENIEEVDVITLDDYVKQNNIEVGLIKVDIEGAEQLFLQGAKETIISQKPILIISIYHGVEDFFKIKPMIEAWNLGYRFKIHKMNCSTVHWETILIAEV